jgi:hypothetical protein
MFSMTTQQERFLTAFFSFRPRLRMGHRIAKVDESTVATNVVAMSSSTALYVSIGFEIALTTAGMAGETSGFSFVWHTANRA